METTIAAYAVFRYYEFKSYYVVWKQNTISPGIISKGLFKSYYVVWKLHITLTISHTENSLNRTM